MLSSPPIVVEGLDIRTAGNEVIVHDPTHEKVHVLNSTAALVLELCDGRHSTEEIAAALSARTGAPLERVRPDVEAVLRSFRELAFVR
jgi:hypothetical protein